VLGIAEHAISTNKIARYFTNSINEDFGTKISIDEVAISFFEA
jgi:hypothetical protein